MRIAPEIRVRGVKKTILSPYQIFKLLSKTLKVHETRAALSFHCWEVFRGSLFWPVKIKEQAQKHCFVAEIHRAKQREPMHG